MRVIIDTNILIAGSWDDNSIAKKIIEKVINGEIHAFATHQTMRENRLLLKRTVNDGDYRQQLQDFFQKQQIVKRHERVDVVSDKEDNKLFESAEASGADFLITNDKEVLGVGKYRKTKVVTPEEFWAMYENEKITDEEKWSEFGKMILGN